MSVVQWNPWREFDDLFARFAGSAGESLSGSDWLPPVNISEDDNAYRIELEIPAVPVEDVKVSVKDGVLTISGERKQESEETGKRHRVERRYGRFVRSFRLPENVDEDGIEASSRHGVLYLRVAKKEKPEPRTIEVQVH